jgi:acetoin utilization protein AcuB
VHENQEAEMKIKDFMSTNVVAVDEDTTLHDARKIMEAHKIRRLPVMKKGKLVGLVTLRMLLEAAPSPATDLSIHELQYLLAKMTVKDIMVKNPHTVSSDMPAEEALQLGQEMGYGAFPVVDNGRIVGIITESDIVRVMTKVLGVRVKGKRIDLKVTKQFGNMQQIMAILDDKKALLLSLMTFLRPEESDYMIILRIQTEDTDPIVKDLKAAGFTVTYVG